MVHEKNRIPITDRIWIGFPERSDEILKACEPRNYAAGSLRTSVGRKYGTYYAICHEIPASREFDFNFDPDHTLHWVVALSRLVRPNPTGFEYSARCEYAATGELHRVWAAPWQPAFGVNLKRCWLSRDEWKQTARLVARRPTARAFTFERIKTALWYRERAALEHYVEVRSQHIATVAEALTGLYKVPPPPRVAKSPRTGRAGKQQSRGERFRIGLCKLATDAGISLSTDQADVVWQMRSHHSHGASYPFGSSKSANIAANSEIEKVELVVSAALRRAIEDDSYAQNFESDVSVSKWLP